MRLLVTLVTADNRANCAHPIEWLVKWVLTKIDSIAASWGSNDACSAPFKQNIKPSGLQNNKDMPISVHTLKASSLYDFELFT